MPIVSIQNYAYQYLRRNYPSKMLGWVYHTQWRGPLTIKLSAIALDQRPGGKNEELIMDLREHAYKDGAIAPIILVRLAGANKFTIVDGFHRAAALKALGKKTIVAFVGINPPVKPGWHERLRKSKQNIHRVHKGYGDAKDPIPFYTTPSHQREPSQQVDQWAGETTDNQGTTVLDCYRRALGDRARSYAQVINTLPYKNGTMYVITDGHLRVHVFASKDGPARLMRIGLLKKGFSGAAPMPNSVWTALMRAGEPYYMDDDGNGRVHNAKIFVEEGKFTISGKRAEEVLRLILRELQQAVVSEDRIDNRQSVNGDETRTRPW